MLLFCKSSATKNMQIFCYKIYWVFDTLLSHLCDSTFLQWIYGFLVFFYPGGTSEIRHGSHPWHVLFGMVVYILAVATASLGFLEKLTFLESSGVAKYGSEAFLVNFTAIITALFGVFVILTVLSEPVTTEDDYSYTAIWFNCIIIITITAVYPFWLLLSIHLKC